ncbi:helicase [Paenibacillus herberti]|uniref:Helicase n=2 Tax=Paenibacillus herberti TaxID=1619309 RepID=A0A229NV68_9BACL|nr:helicase-related protein [Paenibacillus herberti]OXM13803.1 helicase [Paenibacillus herberti]
MLKIGDKIKGPYWSEVVEIRKCEPIDDLLILIEAVGRQSNQYYETYLEKHEVEALEALQEETQAAMEPHRLLHYLQYYVLRSEERYSKSRMRGNKKVIPLPHQIEAVYSRMLQNGQVRFLLADDPGAGKTIMSGMLIRELLARKSADRILILVPPLVLKQWQEELNEKFGEQFTLITRSSLRDSGDGNPFEKHDKCLASLYWATREDVKNLVITANFDLVIVDEAHKMAAYTQGVKKKKVQRTKLYQLGEAVLRNSEHCLLLTATPHKGDKENFRHLMSLIDHDVFSNLNTGESMYEKSNPYVIRRLKESMVNFDGTPLFPKRTTKTLPFDLSTEELEIYQEVTEYVREHFNRAKRNNNHSTAFAMMLLQRRLTSSIEAIYLSLVRRKERLEQVLRGELKKHQITQDTVEEIDELTGDELEAMEQLVEGETDALDIDELQLEIDELARLIRRIQVIRMSDTERKYLELESTLFGTNGLLLRGEKILIFTESKDTLHYLERRLLAHVPYVAKIIGNFSMDQRREEVEKFRRDIQIMLATDAGGESINLQFCNQMINYDIPWNPNRLEQRMGRIHRIGQKNEVFVFNLVATNTREGDVMNRLLEKMEQMRLDLGQELVYDFIGEVLEEEELDLASLMEQAISGREHLDEIIARMEKRLSEEHQKLLEFTQKERIDEQSFDLPGMKRDYHSSTLESPPSRVYGGFTLEQFQSTSIRLHVSSDQSIVRIERFPKMIREFARKQRLYLKNDGSHRFTLNESKEKDDLQMLKPGHDLVKLALSLTEREIQQLSIPTLSFSYHVGEPLRIELNEIVFTDGTGRELQRELLLLGKRSNRAFVRIDSYWLFAGQIENVQSTIEEEDSFKPEMIKQSRQQLNKIRNGREEQLNKKSQFLRRSFEAQMNSLYDRLQQYQNTNTDHRNSALINQTLSSIEETEERRNDRLEQVDRERSIQIRSIKKIAQFHVVPHTTDFGRVLPIDYEGLIRDYEIRNGRTNVKMQHAYGLVDFVSEDDKGEIRFIILSSMDAHLVSLNMQDYSSIMDQVWIYRVSDHAVTDEVPFSIRFNA